MTDSTVSITNHTKTKIQELASPSGRQAFVFIKDEILGKKYSLSIAFVSEQTSQEVNLKYRNKNKPTNVLSFALSPDHGEILLCPSVIKKESKNKNKNFGKSFKNLVAYLLIHGILHLKGMDHSEEMERQEELFFTKYLSRTKIFN